MKGKNSQRIISPVQLCISISTFILLILNLATLVYVTQHVEFQTRLIRNLSNDVISRLSRSCIASLCGDNETCIATMDAEHWPQQRCNNSNFSLSCLYDAGQKITDMSVTHDIDKKTRLLGAGAALIIIGAAINSWNTFFKNCYDDDGGLRYGARRCALSATSALLMTGAAITTTVVAISNEVQRVSNRDSL
ncbi:LAFA_0C10704g1_1 [Lachancea sp. 'fantastica']|nr:LAFA_0C10704g1_1 [Lachancea sp. 'fantastica']